MCRVSCSDCLLVSDSTLLSPLILDNIDLGRERGGSGIAYIKYMYMYLPVLFVDSLESSRFPWQRTTSEYRLKVDPLPLDLVESLEDGVQLRETRLPETSLVLKTFEIRRILEGLQETLIVPNLQYIYMKIQLH